MKNTAFNAQCATVAKQEYALDNAQLADLRFIAAQCPLAGGNAVFEARALLSMANDTLTYNDATACLSQGLVWREGEENDEATASVVAYPNPSDGDVTLQYTLAEDAQATVYDATGRVVSTILLRAKAHEATIPTLATTGVYVYVVRSATTTLQGKIVIIR